jgi:competence protein ComEC
MNRFVEWVASKEAFLFDQISFDLTALIISYLILFLLRIFYHKKTFKNLIVLGGLYLSFSSCCATTASPYVKKCVCYFP